MTGEWFEMPVGQAEIKRGREKARALRNTDWWRARLSKGVCHYCGREVGADALTMDHVIPLARGGKSVKSNVVPCCKDCNSNKKTALPVEAILDRLFPGGGEGERTEQ